MLYAAISTVQPEPRNSFNGKMQVMVSVLSRRGIQTKCRCFSLGEEESKAEQNKGQHSKWVLPAWQVFTFQQMTSVPLIGAACSFS